MKKEIRDYLHLYIDCDALVYSGTSSVRILAVNRNRDMAFVVHPHNEYWAGINQVRPILRKLSDMTTEEKVYFKETFGYGVDYEDENYETCLRLDIGRPEVWLWLLKQEFDLFELIEAGLAIEKTKIWENTLH